MLRPEFPHLNLIQRFQTNVKLEGGGKADPVVDENLSERGTHSTKLFNQIAEYTRTATERQRDREEEELPTISGGVPFVLQVPSEDDGVLEFVAERLGLEIVAEYDDGFLIVATSQIDLTDVIEEIRKFSNHKHGSGSIAKIKEIDPDPASPTRLVRILDERLLSMWPLPDEQEFILDVSIEAAAFGAPKKPRITVKTKNDTREAKLSKYEEDKREWFDRWEGIRRRRESEIEEFEKHYRGTVLQNTDDSGVVEFPDSFSMRIRMLGRGFNDLILNYPNLFEVVIPDDIEQPLVPANAEQSEDDIDLTPPDEDAAAICVIDSGLQENHRWLQAAVDHEVSHCFIPELPNNDVADYVSGGGHGTSVAGAVLYPHQIPVESATQAPFWILNARVLDDVCCLPTSLYPPKLLVEVAALYSELRNTRLFVHSINSTISCRLSRMSAWASTIDVLAYEMDALFFQSVGNVPASSNLPSNPGILNHYNSQRKYPRYLEENSARIANPAQSLQAISVGSISADSFRTDDLRSIARKSWPSSFSRWGLGLWDSIKPDVVEVGGDLAISASHPPQLTTPEAVCPELLRSTLHGGPPYARDKVGTSFAAPKVAHIAGHLQRLFPDRSTLLYRALIINSARWPRWAEQARPERRNKVLRSIGYGVPSLERAIQNSGTRVTLISDDYEVKAREGYVLAVPIPESLRRPGDDFKVRIDVTLSYVAKPRRTRRSRRGYLGVWLDWKTSRKNEPFESFCSRVLRDVGEVESSNGHNLKWALGNNRDRDGETDGVTRKNGTVQKDWTVISSYELPEIFGVVVRGHPGWERRDQAATAKFAIVVSFEAIDVEVPIYAEIRQAVEVEIEAEVEV